MEMDDDNIYGCNFSFPVVYVSLFLERLHNESKYPLDDLKKLAYGEIDIKTLMNENEKLENLENLEYSLESYKNELKKTRDLISERETQLRKYSSEHEKLKLEIESYCETISKYKYFVDTCGIGDLGIEIHEDEDEDEDND